MILKLKYLKTNSDNYVNGVLLKITSRFAFTGAEGFTGFRYAGYQR